MTEKIDILNQQEALLQFDQFQHQTAYDLGTFMAQYAKDHEITIAVSIRMNTGEVLFQYLPDGTNLLNQKWMERKFNTVKLTQASSLKTTLIWERDGDTPQVHGVNPQEYAICGGGFPIRIKGSSDVIGAIIASNLYHIADHEFVVDCLREFLQCSDAPAFPYTIPE